MILHGVKLTIQALGVGLVGPETPCVGAEEVPLPGFSTHRMVQCDLGFAERIFACTRVPPPPPPPPGKRGPTHTRYGRQASHAAANCVPLLQVGDGWE